MCCGFYIQYRDCSKIVNFELAPFFDSIQIVSNREPFRSQDWRSTVAITCSLAIIFVVIMWNVRKSTSEKSKRTKENDTKENDAKEIHETVTCENNVNHCKAEVVECTPDDTIPELPDPKWVKTGQVQELYVYPLKSGRGKDVKECNFTEYGISIEQDGRFTLRDRWSTIYLFATLRRNMRDFFLFVHHPGNASFRTFVCYLTLWVTVVKRARRYKVTKIKK